MFKSIRWKITILFVLLIFAVELAVGFLNLYITADSYHKDFASAISDVFNDSVKTDLTNAANEVTVPEPPAEGETNIIFEESTQNNVEKLKAIMSYYSGSLGVNASRFYDILDGQTGAVLYSSNNASALNTTPSILGALNGTESSENRLTVKYMDYALPLGVENHVKYIIYVRDTQTLYSEIIRRMFVLLLYSLLFSLAAAFIIGSLMSRAVAVPIRQLTIKARKLADGDLNALEKAETDDELGHLTNSLLYLAHTRQESTDRAMGETTKVETILQNMTDGILAFDLKGNLTHYNPEAKRLLNRQYFDDINFDRFFKEINANITLGDLLYMKPEGSMEREIKLKNQFLQLNFATFSVDNKLGGIIVIIRDVTRLEKLEQSRRDFVANVSHELRTPLTTIKSYSETLADMPDADRELQIRFLDVIASESDRMARIISDLLTLSELDENQTFYKTPEPIDIRKVIESIVERMNMSAKKKNQRLTYRPINEAPIISGDRDSLERIIINIISNAIKYTGEGGKIDVYSSKVYKDIVIKVVDNGIGIKKDQLPHIFDRFYRVDKARSRDTGGTGLGLAIAKQALESAFNGKIKISSEFNKGTEVTITIPVSE